jgi:hypothetical protein
MTTTTGNIEDLPLEEQVEQWKHLAETMRDHAERFKAERDELLDQLPVLQGAEQFMAAFLLFQQQFMQQHPQGYVVHTPQGVITLSTGAAAAVRAEKNDDVL